MTEDIILLRVFRRLLLEGDYTDTFGVEGHRTLVIDSGLRLTEDEYAAVENLRKSA